MFAFRKIRCALFSCYFYFEIRPFALLPTKHDPWFPAGDIFDNKS